ncbi:macrophage mannose receptor 1-like isoform X2 [Nymphalis io]|uniref:macrophage mannose receptor 1-like isoform X2 n=1 Tax=Inachis io TaxID=171585 RepID=UPI002169ABBC|nr:macrophage mannose receptor 1-like isoform X2 [Nymphalis io]
MIIQNYLFLCLLLACSVVCISGGRLFRFDYEYNTYIDGWLKLHVIPATWHDAWLRCDLEGSILASPINHHMKLAMDTYWKTKNINECAAYYTGISALFSKGDFFSIDGISLAKMPVQWAPGEPDNSNNNEDCIVLTNGSIADINCSEIFPYMCFKKKTKDMIMTTCGTVDKEYKLEPLTGNCYKFHQVGKTWTRAFMTCAGEGGYLAVINSQNEALHLKNLYDANFDKIAPGVNKDVIHIGMHDWNEHGVWRTIHGLKIADAGYAEWQQGQPDNSSGQFCGAMFRNSKLDDFWCSGIAPFICEKSPDSLLEP